MAILNQKEVVFDIVLTDYGRELMSKNQLNFKYYAFGDGGVDYSGLLSSSAAISSSFDDYIHRDLSFEATQMKDKDLSSFLYTIPLNHTTLPEFKISVNVDESIDLERRYFIDQSRNIMSNATENKPLDIVARVSVPQKTALENAKEYALQQRITKAAIRFAKRILG